VEEHERMLPLEDMQLFAGGLIPQLAGDVEIPHRFVDLSLGHVCVPPVCPGDGKPPAEFDGFAVVKYGLVEVSLEMVDISKAVVCVGKPRLEFHRLVQVLERKREVSLDQIASPRLS